LSLEVLKGDVSLANRTLRTTAVELETKADPSLVLVTIPIAVVVQTEGWIAGIKNNVQAQSVAREEADLEPTALMTEREAESQAVPKSQRSVYSQKQASPMPTKASRAKNMSWMIFALLATLIACTACTILFYILSNGQ
jgi:hypothetical protein